MAGKWRSRLGKQADSEAGSWSSVVKRTDVTDITLITAALHDSNGTVASVASCHR